MTISYTPIASTTQTSSTLANQAIVNAIKTAITAHPAWSTVEDVTVGTGNYRWVAFKCDHTVSAMPNDFYVLVVWNATTGVSVYCGESYTTATHTLTWPCGGSASATVASTTDASGHYSTTTATLAPTTTGAPTVAGGVTVGVVNLGQAATTIYYHFCVYDDHLYLATGTTATNQYSTSGYVGGFTSLTPSGMTDAYPIAAMPFAGTGYLCRNPEFLSTSRYAGNLITNGLGTVTSTAQEYAKGGSTTYDFIQAGYPVTRCFVEAGSSTASGAAVSSVRGRWNNYIYSGSIPPNLSYGDTVNYNGTQWACIGNAVGHYIDTGQAAA